MCQARIYSLYFFVSKNQMPCTYLFSTKWLLLLIIDKFTISEFTILIKNLSFLVPPSTMGEHIYRVSVILRKGIFQISSGWLPPLLLFLLICTIESYMSYRNLLNIAFHHRYFSTNFTTVAEQRYWKMYLDGCFWGQFYFRNIPAWLLLKSSCRLYSF